MLPFKTKHQLFFLLFTCALTFTNINCKQVLKNDKKSQQPNLLLIVADDLGYADLGCYGSDIETPNIDQLAVNGVRFSRFHTSPFCAPTRAMLLSGNDNHIAGMGVQSLRTEEFGYEGMLTDRIVPMPELLKQAGYHTYMAGKWHLGRKAAANAHQKGFERSFTLIEGAGNHYDDQGLFDDTPISVYTEDGKPAKWENGNYSTDFYTDKIISYIEQNRQDGKPFFAFAAYTSPHWPLQVDEKYWKKYEGRYDEGYDKLKEQRLASLKKAGMIPQNAQLPPNNPIVKPWNSLSAAEQKMEARKMELYAGMVDNLDENVGRLIQYLKDIGEYDNTLIVFMSDNGAAAEDFYYHETMGPFIREHFNDDFDKMGQPSSFISYGPQWAEAGSSPFRYHKSFTTEGGMIAPMIMTGLGVDRKSEIRHDFLTLMDIAPTFYEMANVTYPNSHNGKAVYPLKGKSIASFIGNQIDSIHTDDYVFALEHEGYAMIRKGDWKIVNIESPFSLDNFKLYNLKNDLAELYDVKATEPEKYAELLKEWKGYVAEVKVQNPPPGTMD